MRIGTKSDLIQQASNNIIIIINLVRGITVFRALLILPGETPTSAHPVSHLGKDPHSAHFGLARSKYPLSAHVCHPLCAAAVGFQEPPNKPAWLRETPNTTIPVFPTVTVTVILLGRVSPYVEEVSTPTLRSLTPAVWDLPKQAHNPLFY